MAFEYRKLKGRIVEKYGSQGAFAAALGTTDQTISRKMNAVTSFSTEDIKKWSELLNIKADEIGSYFFE